jgi:uncharacterized SAM-binding protein YcdF (DUF218 family)
VNPPVSERRKRAIHAALGALVGSLAFVAADRLGLVTALGIERLLDLDEGWLFWIAAFFAGVLSATRARAIVPFAAASVSVVYALVAYTDLAGPFIRSWALHEEPCLADAIVVLSSDVTDDGHISSNGVTRLLAGLELARSGYAPLLIRTDISPPRPDDTEDARTLAGDIDVEIALVGPVASTRDEAVATAELMEQRGLHRVIVVTQPFHERRAAATFRNVGLEVVAVSSPERNYSLDTLPSSRDRVEAFRDWITEQAAWTLYSVRGWIRP